MNLCESPNVIHEKIVFWNMDESQQVKNIFGIVNNVHDFKNRHMSLRN